ncbi:MAG: creatininase family protein [Cyanobacteria bacterium J007]|nr:MAG: creatininase family protein [Cyanobacteria bacterium J007]
MREFIPPHRFFPYLTWAEVDALPDKANTVIIQPMGAIEQHGYHLPLVVDSAISVAVLGKALEQLSPEIPAYALPNLAYGKSNEHGNFPGTISLSANTLISILLEIGESLYRAGFRKLILMNSHGGQPQILEIAAQDLTAKYEDFSVFPIFTWRVPNLSKQLMSETERQYAMHAGDAETSLMLSILPEFVQMDKAVCEYPPNRPEGSLLATKGTLSFAWMSDRLSHSGVIGDATAASPNKGDRILTSLAAGWIQLIKEVYNFEPPNVKNHL